MRSLCCCCLAKDKVTGEVQPSWEPNSFSVEYRDLEGHNHNNEASFNQEIASMFNNSVHDVGGRSQTLSLKSLKQSTLAKQNASFVQLNGGTKLTSLNTSRANLSQVVEQPFNGCQASTIYNQSESNTTLLNNTSGLGSFLMGS